MKGGEIDFVEPQIRVRIRNGFGVPARAVVDELYVETLSGDTVRVTGQVVEEGFDFDYPREPGALAFTTYIIDETNSNLKELLAARPTALNYRISALINPTADEAITGYLLDTSTYAATITVELPLYGATADFQVRDSFAVNIGTQYREVTAAEFRITTDNELPFDLSLTGTFVDSLGNMLGDLTDGELLVIQASPVDTAGNTAGAVQATTDIPVAGRAAGATARGQYARAQHHLCYHRAGHPAGTGYRPAAPPRAHRCPAYRKRPMMRALLLALALALLGGSLGAQNLTAPLLAGSWQSTYHNPAMVHFLPQRVTLGLPGVANDLRLQNLQYGDLFVEENGRRILDFMELARVANEQNTVQDVYGIETLGLAVQTGHLGLSVYHRLRAQGEAEYGRDLVELVARGNAPLSDKRWSWPHAAR